MYCGKCGTEVAEEAAFCPSCGVRLGTVTHTPTNARNKVVGAAAVAVVMVALLCGVFLLKNKVVGQMIPGNSEQDVINALMDAYIKADMSNILELIPEQLMESDDLNREEIQQMIEDGNEKLQYIYSLYPSVFGDDWMMSYEIRALEEVESSKLREIRRTYKNYGFELDITTAKRVEVELNVSGSKEEGSSEMNFYLIKVKNSWYVDGTSFQYAL